MSLGTNSGDEAVLIEYKALEGHLLEVLLLHSAKFRLFLILIIIPFFSNNFVLPKFYCICNSFYYKLVILTHLQYKIYAKMRFAFTTVLTVGPTSLPLVAAQGDPKQCDSHDLNMAPLSGPVGKTGGGVRFCTSKVLGDVLVRIPAYKL